MQQFKKINVTIDKAQSNMRLDLALTKILHQYSRSHIKILLLNKNVKISNKIITNPSYKVKLGEVYSICVLKNITLSYEPQNIPLNIIYEDKHLLVINKIAGIVTHPAPGNQNNTLVNALLHHTKNKLSTLQENNRQGIVHRLDKDTSGLLIVAKNNQTHANLAKQFKEHSIHRKYYAIVWGVPHNQIIKGYITRHKINRKKLVLNLMQKGKYSETYINLKKNYGICSLIECTLKTGRTHQVRVHLNSIDSPLIGDKLYKKNNTKKYGKDKKNLNKYLFLKNFQRQALHAATIGFKHPITGKRLNFNTDLPKDMLELLTYISKY